MLFPEISKVIRAIPITSPITFVKIKEDFIMKKLLLTNKGKRVRKLNRTFKERIS
jgi:hypothetical protein